MMLNKAITKVTIALVYEDGSSESIETEDYGGKVSTFRKDDGTTVMVSGLRYFRTVTAPPR